MVGLHVPVIPPTTNQDLMSVWINPLTSKYLTLSNAARSPQWKLVPGGIQRPFLLLFPRIQPTEIPKKNIAATSLFIVVALLEMEINTMMFEKTVIMPIMRNVFNVHSQ